MGSLEENAEDFSLKNSCPEDSNTQEKVALSSEVLNEAETENQATSNNDLNKTTYVRKRERIRKIIESSMLKSIKDISATKISKVNCKEQKTNTEESIFASSI